MKQRSNEEWLSELRLPSPQCDPAIQDLRDILMRGLRFAFAKNEKVNDSLIEDFSQDAILRILEKLDSFKGKSRFTTWANTIAVRTVLGEMRRKRWQDTSLDEIVAGSEFVPNQLVDKSTGNPELEANQERILNVLHNVIEHELTEKQRDAIMAEYFQSVPVEGLLDKLDTNRNAAYKLLHDARKKLKKGLENAGIVPEDVAANFNF